MKFLLMAALSVGSLAPTGQSQPRFSSSVDLLVVSAIARADDGTLVRGLTRDDFELFEDGKPVPLATFAEARTDARTSIDDGRFIVLLLDDMGTHPQYTKRIKDIAHGFADRMGPKDVMSVLMLNGSSSVTTTRPAEVHAAIDRSSGYGKALLSSGGAPQHAIRTIGSLSTQLAKVAHRRKVLVCIGPAEVFNPATHLEGSRGEAGTALRETARANLTTYVIDPLGLNEKPALSTRAIDAGALARDVGTISRGAGFSFYQDGFAAESGGTAFANTNDYATAIDRVWEESGNYYLLGYEPLRRDNRRHRIEVKVKKPGVTVQSRRQRG